MFTICGILAVELVLLMDYYLNYDIFYHVPEV